MTPDEVSPTDLTALMSIDPLDLTKQDLDKIIARQRQQRLAREGGAKTKRATNDAPAVDIKALLGRITSTQKMALIAKNWGDDTWMPYTGPRHLPYYSPEDLFAECGYSTEYYISYES